MKRETTHWIRRATFIVDWKFMLAIAVIVVVIKLIH